MHEFYMRRCLDLALKGSRAVMPNPMVGAVVVANNKIIGEGWHEYFGGPHAEINALKNIKVTNNTILYVSLEPCAHTGKTPPCVDYIIKKKLKTVVIGCQDPNLKVAGTGIDKLRGHGITVIEDICRDEVRYVNRRFITCHEKHRPYIILKWAETADGFIARTDGSSKWITDIKSRELVHTWRTEEHAILIGGNTARIDNPQLTARLANATFQPIRIVLSKSINIPPTHHLYTDGLPTIFLVDKTVTKCKYFIPHNNIIYIPIATEKEQVVNSINQVLLNYGIQSVLVEGGSQVLGLFIESGNWDEIRRFVAPVNFGSGILAPKVANITVSSNSYLERENRLSYDELKVYFNY
jgi:diaminohydroxyphosphoribosylaminopyrimidine deaminase / 5-amino-6-(5-phosphoribosylamino)uracil reductase